MFNPYYGFFWQYALDKNRVNDIVKTVFSKGDAS